MNEFDKVSAFISNLELMLDFRNLIVGSCISGDFDAIDSCLKHWRAAIEGVIEFTKSTNGTSILKSHGDGNWMLVMAKLEQAIFKVCTEFNMIEHRLDVPECSEAIEQSEKRLPKSKARKSFVDELNPELTPSTIDRFETAIAYLKLVRELCRFDLEPAEQKRWNISFDATSSIVKIGEQEFDLTRLSNAAEWFSILWKQRGYLSFPEARRANPDLESANGKRLMDDVNKLIGKKVIISSGLGYRIDSSFRRV
jgi:hypothetical protein